MRKIMLAVAATILVVAAMVAGCTSAPPETTVQPEQPPIIVEGTLDEVSPDQGTVTVQTPRGRQTFPVLPSTGITIEGQACTLQDLEALEASGEPYRCTIVYDDDVGEVLAVDVVKLPRVEPASVRGTISNVNITDSTVTVQTGDGPKVYEVDADTGLLIGGVACSLEMVSELIEFGGPLEECTVIYDVDNQDKVIYVDIANPPDTLFQDTGTITSFDRATSTVTVMTNKGQRTIKVDAETGIILDGAVCSLDQLQVFEQGGLLTSCQVLYFTDEEDNLVYIDIQN